MYKCLSYYLFKKSILAFCVLSFSFTILQPQVLSADIFSSLKKINVPKPSGDVKKVSIQHISLKDINLRTDTIIKNPYPISLPNLAMSIKMTIEGNQLAKLSSSNINAKAGKSTSIPFDLSLIYKDIIDILKKIPKKEALDVGMQGVISIPIPLEKIDILKNIKGFPKKIELPFNITKKIPAIHPSISIKNFRLLNLSESEIKKTVASDALAKKAASFVSNLLSSENTSVVSAAEAGLDTLDLKLQSQFDIVLKNEASAKMLFEKLKYKLAIEKENFMEGSSQTIQNKGNESVVSVNTVLPIKNLTKGIASAIKKRSAKFSLVGGSSIKLPALSDESNIPFEFDTNGDLKW